MGLFNKKKAESNCCCGNVDSLIVKEGHETKEQGCECSCGDNCDNTSEDNAEKKGLVIKVLGSGCKNCITLAENVKVALEEMNLTAEIVKVTDFSEITGYGVMSTPALVVNEKVVSYGKVLKAQEVIKILDRMLDNR